MLDGLKKFFKSLSIYVIVLLIGAIGGAILWTLYLSPAIKGFGNIVHSQDQDVISSTAPEEDFKCHIVDVNPLRDSSSYIFYIEAKQDSGDYLPLNGVLGYRNYGHNILKKENFHFVWEKNRLSVLDTIHNITIATAEFDAHVQVWKLVSY